MKMKKNYFDLIEKYDEEGIAERAEAYRSGRPDLTEAPLEDVLAEMDAASENIYSLIKNGMGFDGKPHTPVHVPLKEAMSTTDATVLFETVFNRILQEPVQPVNFLTNNVAENIIFPANNPNYIEFISVGAIEAEEVGEDGEYSNATLAFAKSRVSMKMKKWGRMMSMTDELLERSTYPLLNIGLKVLREAVDRRVESLCYNILTTYARVVKDNTSTNAALQTKGVASDMTTKNATYSHYDLIDQMGVLIANKYQGTHLLSSPLAWSVFALDPVARATFYHGGSMPNSWNSAPSFDQNANLGFGLTYVPYYALAPNSQVSKSLSTGLTGFTDTYTDIYVIDANNSMYLATKGQTVFDSMDDWFRDGKMLKAYKFADTAAKDNGKGMTVAKDVRIDVNYEPVLNVRNST